MNNIVEQACNSVNGHSAPDAFNLIEQQAERIKELEAYNATRTDELLAATRRIKELERENSQAKEAIATLNAGKPLGEIVGLHTAQNALARIKELESKLDRLYRVGHCGSVDSFLACDDEVKRGYFAMMIEESTDNKKLREELAALRTAIEAAKKVEPVACEHSWIDIPRADKGRNIVMCFRCCALAFAGEEDKAIAPQPAIPAGMVLVPVEPTPKMMAAAGWHSIIIDGYKDMLAAAKEQK